MKPVRDLRRTNWYWIDNAFLEYVPAIGPYAVTVYNYLAKLADQDGIAFPSTKTIANRCGIARSSVFKALDALQKFNIVRIEVRPKGPNEFESNEYHLLPCESWLPCTPDGQGVPPHDTPVRNTDGGSPQGDDPGPPDGQPPGAPHGHNKNPSPKKPYTKQQQQTAAAAGANAVEDSLVQELLALGISPASVAARLAGGSPELARAWLDFRRANPNLGPGFVRKRIESGEFPPNYRAAAAPVTYEVPADLLAAGRAVWGSLTAAQKELFKNDFQQEWWNKYRDEAFDMRNPLHHEAWLRELTDPRTREWLEGLK